MNKKQYEQHTLPDVIAKMTGGQSIENNNDVDIHTDLRPDAVVICGCCGAAMKQMGVKHTPTREEGNKDLKRTNYQYSCRNSECEVPGSLMLKTDMVIEYNDDLSVKSEEVTNVTAVQGAGRQFRPAIVSRESVTLFGEESETVLAHKEKYQA